MNHIPRRDSKRTKSRSMADPKAMVQAPAEEVRDARESLTMDWLGVIRRRGLTVDRGVRTQGINIIH